MNLIYSMLCCDWFKHNQYCTSRMLIGWYACPWLWPGKAIEAFVNQDGVGRQQAVAEGCCRSKFRLHVQAFNNWQLCCRKDIFSLSICWRFVYFCVRFYRRNWFQSKDGFSQRQASEIANLGHRFVKNLNYFGLG